MEKIYFVMPAYNESANIRETIAQWYPVVQQINNSVDTEAILCIANDGSKDDTFEIMNRLKERYPSLEPLDKANSGHGATVLYLYRHAIANGADFIFQTDSDGQTNPDEFWDLFEKRHDYDFQIGHRLGRQDGFSRIFVTKTLRLIVWLMFREWVVDANTPFRLMQRDKLKRIMDVIPDDYFLCNVAIAAIGKKWGYKMRFPRITFKPRQGGVNSINMRRIIIIGWKALSDFRKINSSI